MTTYTAPPPVTNLTTTWKDPDGSNVLEPGITLNWTTPTVTSGTLGYYDVYIMVYDSVLNQVVEYLYLTVNQHAKRDSTMPNTYSISGPATNVFFPFAYELRGKYTYPAQGGKQTSVCSAYSFHVYARILENPNLRSEMASITAFRPRIDNVPQVVHLNPRFNVNLGSAESQTSGFVDVFKQNSYEDVASCVEMVLNTPTGWRSAEPDFGVDDPTFTQVSPNTVVAALKKWEPRAGVIVSIINDDSPSSAAGNGADNAIVNVQITSINGTA